MTLYFSVFFPVRSSASPALRLKQLSLADLFFLHKFKIWRVFRGPKFWIWRFFCGPKFVEQKCTKWRPSIFGVKKRVEENAPTQNKNAPKLTRWEHVWANPVNVQKLHVFTLFWMIIDPSCDYICLQWPATSLQQACNKPATACNMAMLQAVAGHCRLVAGLLQACSSGLSKICC